MLLPLRLFACVPIAARLSLILSFKKPAAILASHPNIEQIICLRLACCRAPCRVVSSHRDLGIQFAIGKGRHTGILMSRLKASKQRLYTISRLSKLDRAARKLTRTGALPQALWGSEIIGICRTTRARLRSSVAGASGINQASRCATTAITLAFDRDPEVEYIRRHVGFWLRSLTFITRSLSLREAWGDAYKQVVSGQKHVGISLMGPSLRLSLVSFLMVGTFALLMVGLPLLCLPLFTVTSFMRTRLTVLRTSCPLLRRLCLPLFGLKPRCITVGKALRVMKCLVLARPRFLSNSLRPSAGRAKPQCWCFGVSPLLRCLFNQRVYDAFSKRLRFAIGAILVYTLLPSIFTGPAPEILPLRMRQ